MPLCNTPLPRYISGQGQGSPLPLSYARRQNPTGDGQRHGECLDSRTVSDSAHERYSYGTGPHNSLCNRTARAVRGTFEAVPYTFRARSVSTIQGAGRKRTLRLQSGRQTRMCPVKPSSKAQATEWLAHMERAVCAHAQPSASRCTLARIWVLAQAAQVAGGVTWAGWLNR